MKNEQWFRRVEVKRATKGEDLSVNLISQDYGRVKKKINVHLKVVLYLFATITLPRFWIHNRR